VSPPAASPAPADNVLVEFPATEGYRSVGRLVLGGLASRFELPVDRVEDLLLAVESLLLHGVAGDTVTLEAEAGDDGLRVRLGPFAEGGVGDPAVARIVTRLVDEAREITSENGEGAFAELLVSAARHGRDG
jgi:hypothetical protein